MIVHLGQQLEVPEHVALCPECGGKLTEYVSEIVPMPKVFPTAAGEPIGRPTQCGIEVECWCGTRLRPARSGPSAVSPMPTRTALGAANRINSQTPG